MINNDWDSILKEEINSEYFKKIMTEVNNRYNNSTCYPEYKDIFNALNLTSYHNTKVVILGQDPYHGEKEAHGLAFSVYDNIKMPPSLRNIFKELNSDLGINHLSTDLSGWAKEGVLLLNTVLTVEKDKPASHKLVGWQQFTDAIIKKLNHHDKPLCFILWGNYAISKQKLITDKKHLVICAPHPSPLSAYHGFFGSKPFSKCNTFLKNNNLLPINWQK